MDGFVEDQRAIFAVEQGGDDIAREGGVRALADAVVLDRIGIGQHEDAAIALPQFAEQDAVRRRDQRREIGALDELDVALDGRVRRRDRLAIGDERLRPDDVAAADCRAQGRLDAQGVSFDNGMKLVSHYLSHFKWEAAP